MKLSISACLLTLAVAACATSAGFEKKMNKWIGRPVNDLYAKLGKPNSTQSLSDGSTVVQYDRSRVVQWTQERTELVPQQKVERQSASYGQGLFGPSSNNSTSSEVVMMAKTIPAKTETISCSVRFRVDKEEIIQSASWEGKGCKARE
jgi:hypothetical protein